MSISPEDVKNWFYLDKDKPELQECPTNCQSCTSSENCSLCGKIKSTGGGFSPGAEPQKDPVYLLEIDKKPHTCTLMGPEETCNKIDNLFELSKSTCLKCPQATVYVDGGESNPPQCAQCPKNCLKCSDPGSCQTCASTYFKTDRYECQKCQETCQECTSQSLPLLSTPLYFA